MNITQAAIEKKQVTIVFLLVILVAGFQTYQKMPRAEDPGFVIRAAQVTTFFPGASPERVEQLVTDKLEKIIQEIPEIDYIDSESKTGMSVITVNIKESYKHMRPIWDNLRRKVEDAEPDLPQDVIGPFVNDEFGDVFGIILALTGEGYTYAELKEIADDIRSELLLIEDVAKVDIHGIQEERVFVEYNNARLAKLGLSPLQLQQILEQRNIIIPGGEIFTEDEQIALEPTGNFDSVADLEKTIIKLPARNEVFYLKDLVHIYRGYIDPPTSMVRYMGKPALALAINLRKGGNILRLGDIIKKRIKRFRSAYPIGVEFAPVAFQPIHVQKKVNDFVGSLLQAVGIVFIIMLIFLGMRTGLVVASLIPMAMITSILIMPFFNVGLDQMSLAALIIALGMLVDNAIVMSESIMVQMADGTPPVKAAIDSANELRIPLLTSSLTTAAAFLPIYLAESTVGEYTAAIFIVVTITLLGSWILSLSMTPLLCVKYLKVETKSGKTEFNTRFYRVYRGFLLMLLRHPLLSMALTIGIFAISIYGFKYVPKIFFPPNDKPVFFAELILPISTPLSKTQKIVSEIERFIEKELLGSTTNNKEGVIDWASFIGRGAPRYVLAYTPEPPSPEYAYLLMNATSMAIIHNELIPKLDNFCLEKFPDLSKNIRLLFLASPVDNPVEVRISGEDSDTLFAITKKVKERLATISGIGSITDDWGQKTKKLLVKINQPRALRAGLTSRDIAVSLQTVLSGLDTTDYREEDEVIPITLRSVAADRKDIGKLEAHNLYVQTTGRSVPLKQVADIEILWQSAKILRRDRLKTITVEAGTTPDGNAIEIGKEIEKWLKDESKKWGIGYRYELGGEKEKSGDANDSISAKLPISALIILLLLIGQFNSIRKVSIIILTIPLAIIGVCFGLLITKSYFGFMTLLGVVSLAGIVINNAIVLLDRIRIEIEEKGLIPQKAVIEAAQRRLRPILLTVATTVGGLLPLWFGGGPMWEPLAISIIFGLIFATVLTLGIVPVFYSIFFKVNYKEFTY